MFWGTFRWEKVGPGLFFEVEKGKHINSIMYHDQVLAGPLNDFWSESFLEADQLWVMKDSAPVHKRAAKIGWEELDMIVMPHLLNSPDLNSIENIWTWIKFRLARNYTYISLEAKLKRVVLKL